MVTVKCSHGAVRRIYSNIALCEKCEPLVVFAFPSHWDVLPHIGLILFPVLQKKEKNLVELL